MVAGMPVLDDLLRPSRSDGERDPADVRLRDFHHGVDGLHLRQHRQVGFLLLVRDGDMVERPALFLGEHLQDVAGGNAAERIEPVLWEMQFVAQGDHLPRSPVQRHGVGKRAVAVEDESFDVRRECHVFSPTTERARRRDSIPVPGALGVWVLARVYLFFHASRSGSASHRRVTRGVEHDLVAGLEAWHRRPSNHRPVSAAGPSTRNR
jgi:hypothetical protein